MMILKSGDLPLTKVDHSGGEMFVIKRIVNATQRWHFLGDEMKKVFILILIFVNFFSIAVSASERETNENIDNYLSNFSFDEIFELQKKAGNNFDDWFLFSILRSEKELDINLYKGLLRHYISDNYEKYGYLNKNLMTEWHR